MNWYISHFLEGKKGKIFLLEKQNKKKISVLFVGILWFHISQPSCWNEGWKFGFWKLEKLWIASLNCEWQGLENFQKTENCKSEDYETVNYEDPL